MMEIKMFPEKGFSSNSYLIISEKEGLLIDPGDNAKEILQYLKKEDIKLRTIVNTHGHIDHIKGNQKLMEETLAPLLIHREDGLMLNDSKKNLSFFLVGIGDLVEGPLADTFLEGGEKIQVGDEELEVLHTPGHTPGGISLLGRGVLFSGDTIFAQGIGRTDFPGGSMEILMTSIQEKILTLDDDIIVYSGHGEVSTIGRIQKENPFL